MADEGSVDEEPTWWITAVESAAWAVLETIDIRQALEQAETDTATMLQLVAAHAEELFTDFSGSLLTFSGRVDWLTMFSSRRTQVGAGCLIASVGLVAAPEVLFRSVVATVFLAVIWAVIATVLFALCTRSFLGMLSANEHSQKILQDDIIAPFVRLQLNQLLDEQDHPPILRITQAPALAILSDAEQLYITPAMSDVARLTRHVPVGSIGVSGPRGVGKTTLLRYFSDRTFEASALGRELRLDFYIFRFMVSAPVHYDAREFVLHIFSKLCNEVSKSVPALRKEANGWQHKLRYQYSSSSGVSLGMPHAIPGNVAFGRQRSELPMTLPELIEGMRTFANQAIKRWEDDFWAEVRYSRLTLWGKRGISYVLRPRFFIRIVGLPRAVPPSNLLTEARILIGVDELDKMNADAARDFLNEIKALFGMSKCLYLVSVSDEALRIYEQRMIFGHTAFDSAFDEVVRVEPLDFDSCRDLMRRRIAGLPDSLIAFCHVMSGGVPRDMIRVTRSVLDSRARGHEEIPRIVEDVVDAQIKTIRRATLAGVTGSSPADALPLRVGLYFYETVLRIFVADFAATVKLLRAHDETSGAWIDRLASAWSIMSVNPALAQEMIDDYRKARGLRVPRRRLTSVMLAKRVRA